MKPISFVDPLDLATSDRRELLIGCGSTRDRRLTPDGRTAWANLTTLDNNPAHKPDVVFDLRKLARTAEDHVDDYRDMLPFEDNTFDAIHAYEVLEHIGAQGDYMTFFAQFEEFHRILKPGGFFCATCPSYLSSWAWGDPSHTRVLTAGTLAFLSQAEYVKQVGKTAMSDFRHVYKADFVPIYCTESADALVFMLKAIKVPAVISRGASRTDLQWKAGEPSLSRAVGGVIAASNHRSKETTQ